MPSSRARVTCAEARKNTAFSYRGLPDHQAKGTHANAATTKTCGKENHRFQRQDKLQPSTPTLPQAHHTNKGTNPSTQCKPMLRRQANNPNTSRGNAHKTNRTGACTPRRLRLRRVCHTSHGVSRSTTINT